MSEPSAGGGISRVEFERRLIERSLEDEEFRQRLLDDPKGTLERVMNLGENRIEMRIPRSAWFPHDLRFPHS